MKEAKRRGTETKITEEMIQELLGEKGIEYPARRQFNEVATKDAIRHWADAIGDLNPLWRDEEYARKTLYGGLIAPPTWLFSTTMMAGRMGLPGVHGMHSGTDWHFHKPVWLNDRISVTGQLHELIEKTHSEFAGRSFLQIMRQVYRNQKGEIVAELFTQTIRHERDAAREKGKYYGITKHVYNDEELEVIWAAIEREEIRGAPPRYWEDVQVGDKLGPMLKGPLSVRDEVGWLMGAGSPFFRAHKIEYEWERRHPHTLEYVEETGERDVPELVHIFDAFARTIGVERAYDYGCQRMSWLGNLYTNWMGDDAFLWKMRGDLRVFNQMGDITTFEGKVIKKYIEDGRCCVDIEAWGKNQRDEWSMRPNPATVILPSREYGPVVYPNPSVKLMKEAEEARPLDELIKEGII